MSRFTSSWTHEGHLVAGLWYVWHFGPVIALEQLRARIANHNSAVGTPNTADSGYHETITRLYVEAIAGLRSELEGKPFENVLNKLLSSPLASRKWPLRYYTPEKLFPVQARCERVAPEDPAGQRPVA